MLDYGDIGRTYLYLALAASVAARVLSSLSVGSFMPLDRTSHKGVLHAWGSRNHPTQSKMIGMDLRAHHLLILRTVSMLRIGKIVHLHGLWELRPSVAIWTSYELGPKHTHTGVSTARALR